MRRSNMASLLAVIMAGNPVIAFDPAEPIMLDGHKARVPPHVRRWRRAAWLYPAAMREIGIKPWA